MTSINDRVYKTLLESTKAIPWQLDWDTKMKVLLVEDNKFNQIVTVEQLDYVGIDVTTVDGGRQALELLARNSAFDAVLMDIQMPDMDGYEVTRTIREGLELTDLPIIAITAHVVDDKRQQCIDAGMNNIISKPVDENAMYEMLATYCNTPSTSAISRY